MGKQTITFLLCLRAAVSDPVRVCGSSNAIYMNDKILTEQQALISLL